MDGFKDDLSKNKKFAAVLAFIGAFQPTPVPLAGIHKFYLGQYGWGLVYMLLGATQVPRIASVAEGLWYLLPRQLPYFSGAAPVASNVGETVDAIASSLREIEQLRQEGLLSEYEFEQKRRSLLEQMP